MFSMERRLAIGVLLAVTVATSGCVAAVTGGTITFEASPATVADGALADQGFELGESDTVEIDRTVEVPVVGTRDVRITNHVRAYGPAAEEGEEAAPAALFLVSTPQAQVAGQGTNPLGRVPLEELVTRVAQRGDGFEEMEKVGSRELTVLGKSTTVEKYSTTTQLEGERVDTFVYVTRVPHGSDYVISVAMLPQQFESEESALFALMRSVEHAEN